MARITNSRVLRAELQIPLSGSSNMLPNGGATRFIRSSLPNLSYPILMALQNPEIMVKKYIILLLLLLLAFLSFSQIDEDRDDALLIMAIDTPPSFKGDLKKFIQCNTIYPVGAIRDSIEGTIYVSFWIDTSGHTSNHKVIRGVRRDLNNEALRVTKLIRFESSALQRGRPIRVKYIVPVEFYLFNTKGTHMK